MIKNISAVLSDRAIVNQCAVNKVSALWKKDVHQLYCNIHPLETITREVKKCLKDNEKGNLGKLFNSKSVCLMERVIMAMNKMRFNDKVGDPKGFVNFLVRRKLGKGLLKRARGNRIHLYFHLAELYVIHYDVFVEFLESYCTVSNPLRNSLLHDFCMEETQFQMKCMTIFGNIFSRVWMKMFYTKSSDELTITYIGAYKLVVEVIETINSMTKDLQLGNLDKDIFGNPLPKHEKVWNFSPTQEPAVNHMIMTMLEASLCVLQIQYKPYMEMNLGEVKKVTGSTRVHNMDAKEMDGLFSAAQDRAPSATMLYLSSKIKATKNKTVDWIQDQPEDQQKRHISLAITVAPTINS